MATGCAYVLHWPKILILIFEKFKELLFRNIFFWTKNATLDRENGIINDTYQFDD